MMHISSPIASTCITLALGINRLILNNPTFLIKFLVLSVFFFTFALLLLVYCVCPFLVSSKMGIFFYFVFFCFLYFMFFLSFFFRFFCLFSFAFFVFFLSFFFFSFDFFSNLKNMEHPLQYYHKRAHKTRLIN